MLILINIILILLKLVLKIIINKNYEEDLLFNDYKKNFNGIKYYENESSENIIDVNKLSASNKNEENEKKNNTISIKQKTDETINKKQENSYNDEEEEDYPKEEEEELIIPCENKDDENYNY